MADRRGELPLDREIILTIPQAAQLIHTNQQRVRNLIKAGYIKALKLGELKIRRQEIDRFLKEAEGYDLNDLDDVKAIEMA